MPMSLRSRLKNLVHKNILSQKDLDRIMIVPDDITNGEIILNTFDVKEVHEMIVTMFVVINDGTGFGTQVEFRKDWWDAPYKRKVENE